MQASDTVVSDELLAGIGGQHLNLRVIEDFRPLHASLQWVLQRAYYERAGASAFIGGDVPFAATSGGQLSQDAAAILFESLENVASVDGPIRCLELGPGSGLFAKLLLDDLRRRCLERKRDYYERTILVLADSSRVMLEQIAASDLLLEHKGHYELVHSDPARPGQAAAGLDGLRAVFLNYLLDNLPASFLRQTDDGVEQLCVRTRLARDVALADYTTLTLTEVIGLAGAPEEIDKRGLADIYPALMLDARYEPVVPTELPEADALEWILAAGAEEVVLHGHGAIACVRGFAERLASGGFVLFNDFPHRAKDAATAGQPRYPIYGGALAIGLNYPQLEHAVTRWPGVSLRAPAEDDYPLVTRLIGRELDPATAACFAERFDPGRLAERRMTRERARKLVDERRCDAARPALVQAMRLAPGDWPLHEEAASFLAYVAKDREAARELARDGLELNPLATGLWNVLGDCELHARRPREALGCYERAVQLDPREVRGRYNASYALTALRDQAGALRMLAEALALDDGTYRERLLAKQARILDRLARRRQSERERTRERMRPRGT